ncbi:TetR/AcrR family transcriptional regulator [Actinomadura kijaniata]|uniref:TetR/AcrR family transcriptional regulator n=1 Tax=Actinomadura kijaniata TaxID=46161 RepID=UPI003F1D433E
MERSAVMSVATRLFAELGYDSTSLQLIADALGTDVQDVRAVGGDKRELYLAVTRHAFEEQRAMLQEALAGCPPEACLHHIADAYLDFQIDHPHIRALWMHRWVMDAVDISGLEDEYIRPLLRLVARNLGDRIPPDMDVHYLLSTMLWCIHGFLGSGVLAPERGLRRADDPTAVRDFRKHMHTLITRMLN